MAVRVDAARPLPCRLAALGLRHRSTGGPSCTTLTMVASQTPPVKPLLCRSANLFDCRRRLRPDGCEAAQDKQRKGVEFAVAETGLCTHLASNTSLMASNALIQCAHHDPAGRVGGRSSEPCQCASTPGAYDKQSKLLSDSLPRAFRGAAVQRPTQLPPPQPLRPGPGHSPSQRLLSRLLSESAVGYSHSHSTVPASSTLSAGGNRARGD